MRPDIRAGGELPDYELPDHEGKPRWLSELQGVNPMILHLSPWWLRPQGARRGAEV
jgi:hypothetical protein